MTRRAAQFSPRFAACALAAFATIPLPSLAQEKKTDADKSPRVMLAVPLAVAAGAATVVRVRGLHLSEAVAVRLDAAPPETKAVIKSKGKAEAAPGAGPADAGDTQVEIELSLPDVRGGAAPEPLSLVVVTPAGETRPYELPVVDAASLVREKEPNNGFRGAQELAVSKTAQGLIEGAEDVDVFKFEAKSGQVFAAEVVAARRGSALDSLLTLYDAAGHIVASNDDADAGAGAGGAAATGAAVTGATADADAPAATDADPGGGKVGGAAENARGRADSILRFKCPTGGTYYVALSDAGARGGPAYPYLLTLKAAE